MGTNFYYKIPLKKREIEDLRNAITEDPALTDFEELCIAYTEGHVIHLGKRSAGWQFLWDLNNGDYYKDNLQSIKDFLNNSGGWVENEYGEKFTVEGFFEDIGPWLYKSEKYCDAELYHKLHPEEPCYYEPRDIEYQSDNLRFSKSTDFS